ncbi:DUF3566 domain-containing protein [Aquiluna borgnonia]|uniref:DUF3566 domain-containing protein n=1 Tax=Aquiluna borgnonia TaxID=2499157 RepID=A0A7D4Q5C2_9MICO|nr:DUF3566 domain-containing protein [Aquiluna borgnonia]QKJ24642.1 DUF3566 domain-containing protein [Aquiluna borgnonia]
MATLFKRNSGPKEPVKQVRLKLRSIDVWSAVKVGFLVSIALGIATLVGALLLWALLANSGIFSSLGGLLTSVLGEGSGFSLENEFSFGNVMSTALSLSLLNIVLTTALSAVWAVIFNLISKLVGGVSVTFTNN